MPDLWMDVDAALTEVPVNIMPLIDDTDFKTIEEAIAYNQAGMDLNWNFMTTAGVQTQTNVTPTTAGDYDWAHAGNGMYTIEMTASGGASANNDTEGFGWFTGFCTGVLPWRGPVIGFRAAALNNALIDGGDSLDVNVTEISGDSTAADNAESFFDGTGYAGTGNTIPTVTTVTNQVTANVTAVSGDTTAADNLEADYDGTGYTKANSTIGTATAVTNQVTADATAISGDSTAADNLEAQYDGTGYTDDNAPATQSQVGNLTSGTAAINTTAESFTKAGAEPETNTYTATTQEDGTYHIVEDDATATDCYYQFDVGGNGVPVSVTWIGYAQSNGDSYTIHAYNYGTTSYEQLGTIIAANGTTPVTETYSLTNAHVGTGANLGKVRFRFLSADGTAFATDRLLCSYAVVSKSVGYAQGAIWVDTNASNTNTEAYVDGVADNPVSTWAAALTLNTTLGLNRFRIHGGSSITLTGDSSSYSIIGDGLITLALGGQTITNAHIENADVSGAGSGSGVTWRNCEFNNSVAIPPSTLLYCGIKAASGTPLTANGAGEYKLVDCVSMIAGSGTPYLDFSGTGGASGVNIRRWSGGINVTLDSNNTLSHEVVTGGGCTITTGGADVEIRGTTRAVTVAMSAAETVQFVGVTGPISLSGTTTATVNLHGVSTSVTDTTSAATVTDNTVSQDNVNAEVDTALSDYDGPTNAEMEARTLVAASYFDPAADTVATVTDVTNQVTADVTAISGDSTAADNLESDYDGTGYAKANSTIGTVTTNTDLVTAAAIADQVWEEAIADHSGTAGSTAEALDNATAPTAGAVADAVWEEAIADHSGTAGSTAEALNAAGAAGDPWVTALPGAYGAGSAGNIVGNLNDPTAAAIADAVLDEALAGHVGAGSLGKAVADIETDATAIVADTNELQTNQGDWATATGFSTHNAADAADAVWDEATAGHAGAGTAGKALTDTLADTNELQGNQGDWATAVGFSTHSAVDVRTEMDSNSTQLSLIVADTGELQTDWADGGRLDLLVDAILVDTTALNDTALPDSVPADGSIPTLKQAAYMMNQFLTERAVSGTTVTVKKVDGSTSLMTFTLDDGTSPTSITRAT